MRAPTPSAAAELAVREKGEFEDAIADCDRRLRQGLKTLLQDVRLRLNRQAHSYVFREPENLVRQYRQNIKALDARMADLLKWGAQQRSRRLDGANTAMLHLLQTGVQQTHQRLDEQGMTMRHRMERKMDQDRQRLQRMDGQLRMLNPLAVLGRGYTLTRKPDGTVVRTATSLEIGEELITQFTDGKVVSNIAKKE
jgi:exodeoxyribonuclease VII large subunit